MKEQRSITPAGINCGVEDERTIEPLDPEQARRILSEETPKRIERLRRNLRELKDYLRERTSGDDREERAA